VTAIRSTAHHATCHAEYYQLTGRAPDGTVSMDIGGRDIVCAHGTYGGQPILVDANGQVYDRTLQPMTDDALRRLRAEAGMRRRASGW
jgi:hypothetical protein